MEILVKSLSAGRVVRLGCLQLGLDYFRHLVQNLLSGLEGILQFGLLIVKVDKFVIGSGGEGRFISCQGCTSRNFDVFHSGK